MVGKTCIISRFVYEYVEKKAGTLATLGAENHIKREKFFNNVDTKIIMTDTSGQDRFESLVANFFRNTDGIILVFDITSKKSYDNL